MSVHVLKSHPWNPPKQVSHCVWYYCASILMVLAEQYCQQSVSSKLTARRLPWSFLHSKFPNGWAENFSQATITLGTIPAAKLAHKAKTTGLAALHDVPIPFKHFHRQGELAESNVESFVWVQYTVFTHLMRVSGKLLVHYHKSRIAKLSLKSLFLSELAGNWRLSNSLSAVDGVATVT